MIDWGLDDTIPPAEPAAPVDDSRPPQREQVPEGDHDLTIREVIRHDAEKKVELRLAHGDKRYGWVFARVPTAVEWGQRLLSSLRTSLGYTPEQWAAMEITDLAGCRVRARIYHRAGNNGRTWVNVARFMPADPQPQPEASAPPAKRTSTKKVDAASRMPGDDIPF